MVDIEHTHRSKISMPKQIRPISTFQTYNSGLQDYGTRPRLAIGPKCKKPAKKSMKNIREIDGMSSSLTKFSYEMHARMTGNGLCQSAERCLEEKSLPSSECIFGGF